jgi:predicted RNA-binding protein with PIN domain
MIHYIIDGHNTIHSIPTYLEILDRDYPSCLEKVITDCADYCDSRNVKIVLVFDGNPPFEIPKSHGNLKVVFSGSNRDADTVIVEKTLPTKNNIVVTNDGGLKHLITANGCRYISPEQFYELYASSKKKNRRRTSQSGKDRSLTPQEMAWWKREMNEALEKKK